MSVYLSGFSLLFFSVFIGSYSIAAGNRCGQIFQEQALEHRYPPEGSAFTFVGRLSAEVDTYPVLGLN